MGPETGTFSGPPPIGSDGANKFAGCYHELCLAHTSPDSKARQLPKEVKSRCSLKPGLPVHRWGGWHLVATWDKTGLAE